MSPEALIFHLPQYKRGIVAKNEVIKWYTIL